MLYNRTLARLLANEHITVEKGPYKTAFFNLKNRFLGIPDIDGATREMDVMLIVHEVGHALETPASSWEAALKYVKKSILNICEDVRIERMMLERFPGLEGDFIKGYEDIHQKFDFFGVKDTNINGTNFLDRLNLSAKLRHMVNVNFTDEEMVFVQRAHKCKTFDEVVALSRDIQKWIVSNPGNGGRFDESEDEEGEGVEIPGSGSDSDKKSKSKKNIAGRDNGKKSDLDRFKCESQDLFDNTVEKNSGEKRYAVLPVINKFSTKPTIAVSAKNADTTVKLSERQSIQKMVQEFNRRRAATTSRRTESYRTGQLDPLTMHRFAYDDNVFKTHEVVHNGTSHGIVIYVDFSSSMHSIIGKVMAQTAITISFCEAVKIPVRVVGFTNIYNKDCFEENVQANLSVKATSCTFVIYDSRMDTASKKKVMGALWQQKSLVEMGGTPLSAALCVAYVDVNHFIKHHNIQKTAFITMTDGGGASLLSCYDDMGYRNAVKIGNEVVDITSSGGNIVAQIGKIPGVRTMNIHFSGQGNKVIHKDNDQGYDRRINMQIGALSVKKNRTILAELMIGKIA